MGRSSRVHAHSYHSRQVQLAKRTKQVPLMYHRALVYCFPVHPYEVVSNNGVVCVVPYKVNGLSFKVAK